MQKLKQLTLAAICCLGMSALFAQEGDQFISKYWVGAGVGINSFEIPNAIFILDPDYDYSTPSNIIVDPHKGLAPSLVLSLFKERKPNRFTSYSFRLDRGRGWTDAYVFNRDLLNNYPQDYLTDTNDELFVGMSPFENFNYFFMEGGLGLYRNLRFLKKWNFLYGFEFMAGYNRKIYLLADTDARSIKQVVEKRFSVGIDFTLLLYYQLSDRTQLFVKSSADILSASGVFTSNFPVTSLLNPSPISTPTSTQGFDFDAALGLRMIHLGLAMTFSK